MECKLGALFRNLCLTFVCGDDLLSIAKLESIPVGQVFMKTASFPMPVLYHFFK
jgi:hypothetical protein